MQRINYTDETRTGRSPEYRALRRVTIAARMDDAGEFEWLRRFAGDHLPPKTEAKSELVLSIIRKNPRARDCLLVDLARATIIIIDIAQYIREVVQTAAEVVGFDLTGFGDPLDAITTRSIPDGLAQRILYVARDRSIGGTMLGRVEWLVMNAAMRAGVPIKDSIINRESVCALSTRDFQELAARFSAALGEALHPSQMADILERELAGARVLDPGYLAVESIEAALQGDHVYDQGSEPAFSELKMSNERLKEALTRIQRIELARPSPAGPPTQADSRRLLGLQAADIAAGLAREIFEGTDGDTRVRADAVRRVFDRVLLNDRWIRP